MNQFRLLPSKGEIIQVSLMAEIHCATLVTEDVGALPRLKPPPLHPFPWGDGRKHGIVHF